MAQIKIQQEGKITVITLDRPSRKNAICKDTALEIQQAFQDFDASDQRVAVITGSGNDAFSSGADVANPPELWRCIPGSGFTTNKPIIAATSGWVVGGAIVLTMMCDLIVASDSSRFSYPEAKLGFTGGMIAGLAARIPHKVAMDLMLLGRTMEAQRAFDVGRVNEIVPVGKQLEVALAHAQILASSAPLVLHTLKHFVNHHVLPRGPSEQMADTMRQLKHVNEGLDAAEGRMAFREKRAAAFVGR